MVVGRGGGIYFEGSGEILRVSHNIIVVEERGIF